MSEVPAAAAKPPRFYVINRGSGSEGSDDERGYRRPFNGRIRKTYSSRNLPSIPTAAAPAITTNIRGPRYQSSYPSLSSPSPTTTSSPTANEESTPPPSTPAVSAPAPVVDLVSDVTPAPESLTDPYSTARNDAAQLSASRSGKFPQTFKSLPKASPYNRSPTVSSPKRPSTSPTDGADRTLILVTGDSERYVNVDITGARNPSFIRECVFSKLNIFEEADQSNFSIYQTEIGTSAIGDALTDQRLFELCRELGDAKGTLKLLVMHSSVPVYNSQSRPTFSRSPTVTTIPPPVFPQTTGAYQPLRTERRPRSRHGSLSSAASEQAPEISAGYEADLDNPDRDTPRTAVRIPTQQLLSTPSTSVSPSSPRSNGRPLSPQSSPQPNSPPLPISPATLVDRNGNVFPVPPPPPPLSPNRATFSINEDVNLTPPANRAQHNRSSSDGPDREIPPVQQSDNVGRQRRQRQETGRGEHRQRPKTAHNDQEDPALRSSESWVMVPRGEQESPAPVPQESPRRLPNSHRSGRHQASSRYYNNNKQITSPFGRPLHIPSAPRNPPPAVPTTSPDTRISAISRPPGQPVPYNWTVTWKGEEKGDTKPSWNRLATKGTRSMDNLRNASKHPAHLVPGGAAKRAPPQLPIHTGATFTSPTLTGLARSFESRTQVRPLPKQTPTSLDIGPSQSSSRLTYRGYLTSSSPDPHPRPLSALGDSPASPLNRDLRQQSPTYHQRLEPMDSRSSRASSPNQQAFSLASRSTYGDRRPDAHSPPPRSPASPRSPRQIPRERLQNHNRREGGSSADISRGDDATLTKEDHGWLLDVLDLPLDGTVVPKLHESLSASSSNLGDSSGGRMSDSFDSDSDRDGNGTSVSMWQRPPVEKPRPALTVQIESSTGVHPVSIPSANSAQQCGLSQSTAVPPHSPSHASSGTPQTQTGRQRQRASTFTERDSSWAPRPPPEDVYERLEDFFPEHDLDKPLIEANSGGTSPTAVEYPIPPAPVPLAIDKSRVKGKKSIRHVAEEHKKRIDRTSKGESSFAASVMRKRSTKLWGSKLEEVTVKEEQAIFSPSLPPESPSGGPTIFKWVRGELIGRGTYGRVYLALNATTGEMIAVKQVEIPRSASDKNEPRHITVVQALKLESETLKDLDHPNIVQYLGFEETPDNLSIFLEYVPGGSIGSCLLKHGKFDEEVTKSFTAQILSGLEYLHSRGIIHRDLKCDNILVQQDGVCKISDFGISKRTDDDGAATAMQGTVFWMAPEVVNPQGKAYNLKIDIWSVGCVVLEMWAGMRPWMGEELVAVMFKLYQMKLPPPVPDDVVLSELGDDFRKKCFAINPDERPSAIELRKHKYLELTPGWRFSGFT
ncbi:MAP kinase [Mycena floridula]|nr:MAP kinase [Mycena floridula]